MDNRTKRQKLEAMANQKESPQEAEIARKKLAELDKEEPQQFKAEPPSQKISKVNTWVDISRDVVITEIIFSDGRVDRKEIPIPRASGVYGTSFSFTRFYQTTQSYKK